MKKILTAALLLVAMFALSSCHDNSPKGVAERAAQCLVDKDFEGYVDLLYVQEVKGMDIDKQKEQYAAMLEEKFTKSMEKTGGLKSAEAISEEIAEDGETATVTLKAVYGNGTESEETMKLKKDANGDWKVNAGK